tara:strand:+ start:238 stop:642 length:405 start_codon:yes stop_codon:yes gene_type:complete
MKMKKRNKDNRFDIDLDFGNIGEEYIQKIFDGDGKVEVKTERDMGESNKWKTTGNMVIEFMCRGKKSGISVTQASTWVHCFYYKNKIEFSLVFNVKELKAKIKDLYKKGIARRVKGGDNNLSDILLIPIKEMIK